MVGGHHVQAAFGGQRHRVLAGRLEVFTVFHQRRAQRLHRRILFH